MNIRSGAEGGRSPVKRAARRAAATCAAALLAAGCGGGNNDTATVASARSHKQSLASPITSIPNYTVTNIGVGNEGLVYQRGINASGQVAGYGVIASTGAPHAFFFDGTQTLDIGTLGGDNSFANAVNSAGQVTGRASNATNTGTAAYSWTVAGSMVPIAPPSGASEGLAVNNAGVVVGLADGKGFSWTPSGGTIGPNDFMALDVNNQGQMAGFEFDSTATLRTPLIRQTDGTKTSLFAGSTYNNGFATFINDAGVVAGFTYGVNRTFTWQDGTLYKIGEDRATVADDLSRPYAINQVGQVVVINQHNGIASDCNCRISGFVWSRDAGITDLGFLDGPDTSGRFTAPLGINNSGQVIGGAGPDSAQKAFTWSAATGLVDLNTKLANAPAGIHLYIALAISDNGSIVAGSDAGLVLLKPVQAGTPPAAPALGPISASDPVAVGTALNAGVAFSDINAGDTHMAQWNWGDATATNAGTISESAGAGNVAGSHVFSAAGVYTISVKVTDNSGLAATVSRDVVIYDPSAGFVTGSGWITSPMGAYKADPMLAGRATFAFVSKYKKGANVPTGETEFQFQAAGLGFRSDTYEWLVVAGARAQYKGVGALNGKSGYKFMLTAVDGAILGKTTPDRFRIKIWHFDAEQNADVVDYDNQIDASLAGGNNEGTVIGGGSIVIHK